MNIVKYVTAMINDWYGMAATEQQIREVIDRHPTLKQDMEQMGVDTCNREALIGYISEDLGCGRWPMNGDSLATKVAHATIFFQKATAAGWKFSPGWLENMTS